MEHTELERTTPAIRTGGPARHRSLCIANHSGRPLFFCALY
jgi:hypothetical protein